MKFPTGYQRTKYACYYTYLAAASVFSLPPILLMTFRQMYDISYTLLGTLVLMNFFIQMAVDLIFTFFAKHFNIKATIKAMPLLNSAGLLLYALIPHLFPQYAYLGLVVGTVLFSLAAGLSEVFLSPMVAAIPSDNPKRDMSILHSLFAYGMVSVVVISTLFLEFCGEENWVYLTLFWAVLPIGSFLLFCISPLPEIQLAPPSREGGSRSKWLGLLLCVGCIFLGSSAENTMISWVSGYMEGALQLPKVWSDLCGLALFGVLLGFGRTLYAKLGRNIYRTMLGGMVGAVVCYLVVGFSGNVFLSAAGCVLTGLCTAMLWPGSLILLEEKIPNPGVAAYALMAAGGDLGGSVAPQLMGVVVDTVAAAPWAAQLGAVLSLSPEQVGMKVGMLVAVGFPLLGVVLLLVLGRYFAKRSQKEADPAGNPA